MSGNINSKDMTLSTWSYCSGKYVVCGRIPTLNM